MARQDSFIQFTGTINGISFYNSKYGRIVRAKGGPDPKKMKTSARFARTRENGKEFGACGRAAGFLRKVLIAPLKECSDHTLVGRLTKVLMLVKNCDATSDRGKRNPEAGLSHPNGKALLNGFDFNSFAPLDRILKKAWKLDTETGKLNVYAFDPKNNLRKPKGATHALITFRWLRLNFTNGRSQIFSSSAEVFMKGGPLDLNLVPDGLPTIKGTDLYVLQVSFFQELNGARYPLSNSSYNCMAIIGVD